MLFPSHSFYSIIRPLLFRLDAETAHRLTLAALARLPQFSPRPDPPELATTVLGLEFTNPLGLAAGMDKDALAVRAWDALGFGFVEIGTITPLPQPGNPKPRIWRLTDHRALINRLGFPSAGVATVAARLEHQRGLRMRLALNLGPNKATPPDRVAEDYADLARRLAPLADFIVINVSSPNTPGLRAFQAPDRLKTIVYALRAALVLSARHPPVLVKIAPDFDDESLADLCATLIDLEIDGVVATNTTIRRDELGVHSEHPGGLSGVPLKALSRRIISRVYRTVGGRLPIIGVGGVVSAVDAYDHIRAGAQLVELYTGLVYQGPGLIRAIKRGLMDLLARDGFRSIREAVGTALD
jgi:dihydroorotate dehydrogenase